MLVVAELVLTLNFFHPCLCRIVHTTQGGAPTTIEGVLLNKQWAKQEGIHIMNTLYFFTLNLAMLRVIETF